MRPPGGWPAPCWRRSWPERRRLAPGTALLIALPLAIAYGFFCLSSWYVARSMPLAATGTLRLAITALTASAVSGGAWLAVSRGWLELVSRRGGFDGATAFAALDTLIFGFGLLLYLLSLAFGYLVAAFEQSRASRNGAASRRRSWRARRNCGRCARRSTRTSSSTASTRSAP